MQGHQAEQRGRAAIRIPSGTEDRLPALLETIPAGAYLCDPTGLITYFNDLAVEIWGRAPRLYDPADRFCGSLRLYSPDGLPIDHSRSWMAIALASGTAQIGEEIVIERPDGDRRSVLVHARPIRNETGELTGGVNLLVDITGRREADLTRARLAALVESSDDAIIGKTLDGRIVSWNGGAERLFGWAAAEAIGQSITLIIPASLFDEEELILQRLRRGERIDHYETVRVAKNGRRLEVSLTSSPIRDPRGRIVGASKVARDITARKARERELLDVTEQLRRVDRTKNEFLATLAHELRNPLAPISNAVEILQRTTPLPKQASWAAQVIDRQLQHLTRLVDDLLDIARINSNKLQVRLDQVAVTDALRSALEASRPLIEARRHELEITTPDEAVVVRADPVRLAQVISNLLNNAAKYTTPGGRIRVTIERDGPSAVIRVADSGIGIHRDMLPRVFDMFAQADQSSEQSMSGLGLGLTLVQRLVELHGGTVTAESEGPGRGSCFTVRLPLGQPIATGRLAG